jgi:hypothetical protein
MRDAIALMTEAAEELDAYYAQEHAGDHPHSVRKLAQAKEENPARAALKALQEQPAHVEVNTYLQGVEARATAAEADAAAARTRVRWLRNGLEEITGVGFDAPATFAGSDAEWERKRANIMQAIARRALGRAET